MNFGLIVVGDEILSGKREDKHLAKVIELLGQRGLALSWARFVGDDRELITAHLRDAFAGNDIVFSCGGIGATPDDHTRQCAAAALGVPLEVHPQAKMLILEQVRLRAAEHGLVWDPDKADSDPRLNMGAFPKGAAIVPNPTHKIPGFSVTGSGGAQVFFVPGFPVMAWPMIEWVLDEHFPYLHATQVQREQSVIVFGAMEAALTPLMEAIEGEFPGIRVFSLPSVDHPTWGRHIELGVKGAPDRVAPAYARLQEGLAAHGASLGPEIVR